MRKVISLAVTTMLAASLLSGCGKYIINLGGNDVEPATTIAFSDTGIQVITDGVDTTIVAFGNGSEAESDSQDDADIPETPADAKRIVCFGDSLTEGTGGDGVSFPSVLAELSGREVLNYGVYSERASLIAARQGGNGCHTEDLSMIPAGTDKVKVNIVTNQGDWEMWCNYGDAGINPCMIAGVLGNLEIDGSDGTRYFTRLEAGDAVPVSNGEPFYTHAMMDKRPDDILVIWSGSTDGWFDDKSIDKIIAHQKSMIEYAGCTEYLIINYTAKPNLGKDIDPWNERLAAEYGDRLLDIRSYIMENGLADAGIEPTEQDLKDMEEGQIPSSLRVDDSHGTADFYRIIGEQVYKKLTELGYI